MDGGLQSVVTFGKGMGWRGRLLSALGFMLITEGAYELYLLVSREISKRKSQKPICEVRFMNRRNVADCLSDPSNMQFGNVKYLISYIDRAQVSISLSMYILTLKDVRDALIRAKKDRSVIIRVIGCDSMVHNEGSQMRHLVDDCFVRFRVNSVHLMHHKFCLLDADWLCGKCLIKAHCELVGAPTKQTQFALFDRAVLNDQQSISNVFGQSCARCDSSKRKPRPNSANPLPNGGVLITGSSNWTVPALCNHYDNMIFTSLPSLVHPFVVEFQRQWYDLVDMDLAQQKLDNNNGERVAE